MRGRAALAVALGSILLLAGCSGSSNGATDAAAPGVVTQDMAVEGGAPAPAEGVTVADTGASAPLSVPVDRQIVRTGYLSMRVEDVSTTVFDVHGLVRKHNGLISSEDAQSSGDATYANITAQIPADALDAFITEVTALGTVDSVNVTAQDVTTQVVDLDARIKALRTSITRLTQLLAEASRIEDLLAIETQLAQRQSELDALTAQRTYLADQVAMSTITVSISPNARLTDVDAPGFLSGLQSGWSAFVSLVMVGITAAGFLLPFLAVLLLAAVPVAIVLVRQARRRRAHVPPPAPASDSGD